jgi:hypothetical protein
LLCYYRRCRTCHRTISTSNDFQAKLLIETFGQLAVDRDGDNLITEIDFVISAIIDGISLDIAKSVFRLFDKNKNGYLDQTEMGQVNGKLSRLYFDDHKVNVLYINMYLNVLRSVKKFSEFKIKRRKTCFLSFLIN